MDFLLHAIGWAVIAVAGGFVLSIVVGLTILSYVVWRER